MKQGGFRFRTLYFIVNYYNYVVSPPLNYSNFFVFLNEKFRLYRKNLITRAGNFRHIFWGTQDTLFDQSRSRIENVLEKIYKKTKQFSLSRKFLFKLRSSGLYKKKVRNMYKYYIINNCSLYCIFW